MFKSHIITAIGCFLLISTLQSQNVFDLLIRDDLTHRLYCAIEKNNGNYLMGGTETDYVNYYAPYLLEVSAQGEIIEEVSYDFGDSACVLADIISIDDSNYVICGNAAGIDNTEFSTLWFAKIGQDLEIQLLKKTSLPDEFGEYNLIFLKKDSDSSFCMYGDIFTEKPNGGFTNDIFIYRYNLQGDSLDAWVSELNYDDTELFVRDLLLTTNDTAKYMLIGTENIGANTLTFFDTALNKTHVHCLPETPYNEPWFHFFAQADALWLDDSTFAIATAYNGINVKDIAILKLDYHNNNEIMETTSFGKPDTSDRPGFMNCFSNYNTSNIYYGGTSNIDYSSIYSYKKSWFNIANFDQDLNFKWNNYYGGDAYYMLEGILPCSDGGCLAYGVRYDHEIQNQELDAYILKVDSLGHSPLSITQIDKEYKDCINLFPNPGKEYFCVEINKKTGSNHTIQLFNTQGKKVKEAAFQGNRKRLEAGDLPVGIYFCRIIKDGAAVYTGKWIKGN